jgi:hypothetical protein
LKFEEIVHVALDELRMQMLGTQVLFGFQLQGVFQEWFSTASASARVLDAAALCLIVLTLGLLIAAPSQHRLVDRGNATKRIFRVAGNFAEAALFPLALALGCDIYVVGEPYWGASIAASAAGAATVVALLLWYGMGTALRATLTNPEKDQAMPKETETDIHAKIDQMLTEARVILPGAQALLGFQFVVTMTKAFAALPSFDRDIHFCALAAVALSVTLLITPAAVHRLTFGGKDVPRMHTIGSLLVTVALIPLALGIAGDFYVALGKILGDARLAAIGAGAAALVLGVLWYAIPLFLRMRKTRHA